MHFTGLVKTATRMYPKKYMDEVEFPELGDDAALKWLMLKVTTLWPMHGEIRYESALFQLPLQPCLESPPINVAGEKC